MNARERVIAALNFKQPDRLPKDLGGMRSTGISAFAYPKLVEALGLAPRRPKIHDVWQMLALPDTDVLDALGCDVVAIDNYNPLSMSRENGKNTILPAGCLPL
jgi:uroporphyrinogen decarboxylase